MADAYDSVSSGVDERKKAMLEAVATGGTRGLKAYEDATKAVTGFRQEALGRAQSLAGVIGGPQEGAGQLADQKYGSVLANIEGSQAAFSEDMSRLGIAGTRALDQMKQAVPLAREQTAQAIAAARAKSAAKSASDITKDFEARALGRAEMDEEDALTAADEADKEFQKAVKSSLSGPTLFEKGTALTKGSADAKKAKGFAQALLPIKDIVNKAKPLTSKALTTAATNRTKALQIASETTPETRAQRARGIATDQLGVTPELAIGKIRPSDVKELAAAAKPDQSIATKAKVTIPELSQARKSPDYKEFMADLQNNLTNGVTREQLEAGLRQTLYTNDGKFKTDLFNVLMAEYGHLFPSISESNRLEKNS